jgi:fibro-slime domain-containing protein
VFVNGQLVVALGGIHAPALGSVTIDAAQGRVMSDVSDGLVNGYQSSSDVAATELGLQPGNVYEVAIFHAERQLDGSSFKLTLSGFESEPSECAAVCGDAILSFGEECDDGDNDGGNGECEAGCVLGPFCGDGIVQQEFGVDCDDGPTGSQSCPGCRKLRVRVR